MKQLALLVLLLMLVSISQGSPSDVISRQERPDVVELSETNASVFDSLDFWNPFNATGHYNSSIISMEWKEGV